MEDDKINSFLSELTALSHKHGIGINDIECAELYELEAEDAERRYSIDKQSLLHFE